MAVPNLFDFATSELSQDAFLAWLVKYADSQFANDDTGVHLAGMKFLNLIAQEKLKRQLADRICVEVKRQYQHIDVYAVITELDTMQKLVLIIEDKVGTSVHGNQLDRYKEVASKEVRSEDQMLLAYCQTYNEAKNKSVENSGYVTVDRKKILSILTEVKGNLIAQSFRSHLEGIDKVTDAWRSTELYKDGRDNWSWLAWQGFYMAVREELGDGEWSYIANPSGGFLGYWWHWRKITGGSLYLQLEEAKACFKVETQEGFHPGDLKWPCHNLIMTTAEALGVKTRKPSVMRQGAWMTVAVLEEDYRKTHLENGVHVIDFKTTINVLKEMERVVDEAAKKAIENED